MPARNRPAGRNTRRHLSLALLLLLAASACGGGGAAGGSTERKTSIPEESVPVDRRPPSAAPTALECGRPFRPPPGGGLALTGRFPTVVSASEQAVSGTVELASETEVRGVVTRNADAFLVRDGRVATLPLPQDLVGMRVELAPGKVEKLPAQATLSPCDAGGGAADGSLPRGTYGLYARVVLNHDDGSSQESFGGPWPLEVR